MTDPENMPDDLQEAIEAMRAEDFERARGLAHVALDRGTDDLRYAFVFAQACIYQEDFEALEAIADALLKTVPDMVIAHVWKGDALRRRDDRAGTLEHYEAAVSNAKKLDDLPPAVEGAIKRAETELPTLRRQLGRN